MESGRYVLCGPNREYSTSWDTIEEVNEVLRAEGSEEFRLLAEQGWVIDDSTVKWGKGPDGRERRPCWELPELLRGAPIGQYHCPGCSIMLIAGLRHFSPDETNHEQDEVYETIHLYEEYTGHEWPMGYYDSLD